MVPCTLGRTVQVPFRDDIALLVLSQYPYSMASIRAPLASIGLSSRGCNRFSGAHDSSMPFNVLGIGYRLALWNLSCRVPLWTLVFLPRRRGVCLAHRRL